MKKVTIVSLFMSILFIKVGAQCTVNFTKTQVYTSVSAFRFTPNVSTNPYITQYHWDFGDGSTSSEIKATHVFNSTDTFNVCLTVSGVDSITLMPFNCSFCDTVVAHYIMCNATKITLYSTNGLTCGLGYSTLCSGPLINDGWDFDDGTTATGPSQTHTFPISGLYDVCATVMLGVNASNPASVGTKCQKVMVGNNNGCSVNFTKVQLTSNTYQFTSNTNPIGLVTNYYWDFSSSALPSITYTFQNNIPQKVCLAVTGIDSMNQPFYCTFCDTVSPTAGCITHANFIFNRVSNSYYFTNLSTCSFCDSIKYKWYFGDGDSSSLQDPSHSYAVGGTYTVILNITGKDSLGFPCSDSITKSISFIPEVVNHLGYHEANEVYPNPVVDDLFIRTINSIQNIMVVDVSGRSVFNKSMEGIKQTIVDFSQYAPGCYWLFLETEKGFDRRLFFKN